MKKIIISTLLLTSVVSQAQQDPMLSSYMFNGLYLNPAYAGSHKYTSSTLLHRSQWVNFDGAPATYVISADGPIKGKNMGLGGIILHDRIGITKETSFHADYSYQIKAWEGKLAFGLRAGGSFYSANLDDLKVWDGGDQVYNQGRVSAFLPRFGAGLYYFSNRWFAGLSVPTLFAWQKNYDFHVDVNKATMLHRHYYLTGGYVFDLNEQWKVKPSALVKYLPGAPVQADFNVNFLYKDMLWLGSSFRTGDAVVFLLEYQTNARFRVGYAYDATFSAIRRYSAGSHEVMIGYDFGKDVVKMKDPRFF
jgi:type IX secretion system PorP/SprF family membrane protein